MSLRPGRGLRPRALHQARRRLRRGPRAHEQQPVRQRLVHLHRERLLLARVRPPHARRHGRHQRRHPGAGELLPVRRPQGLASSATTTCSARTASSSSPRPSASPRAGSPRPTRSRSRSAPGRAPSTAEPGRHRFPSVIGGGGQASLPSAANVAFWEWRSTPPIVRARYMFKIKALLDKHYEEIARITDAGARQGHRRGPRRDPQGHREHRDGGRHHLHDDGLQPRGRRRAQHRRDGRAPAARRLRRHRPLQLPRHGAVLVLALRRGHRQHLHHQGLRADAAHAHARLRDPPGRRSARGRAAARARRQGGRRRPAREPQDQGHDVRRLDARRQVHLRALRRHRQALHRAGRRQELPHRSCPTPRSTAPPAT